MSQRQVIRKMLRNRMALWKKCRPCRNANDRVV